MFFVALTYIAPEGDARFVQIGRYAIGGAALLAFLVAVKAVFFGGAGGATVTPMAVIELAVAVIVLLVVVFIIKAVITWFGIAPPITAIILYVLGGIALIVLLLMAGKALFGGGLGMFGSGYQHRSALTYEAQPPRP